MRYKQESKFYYFSISCLRFIITSTKNPQNENKEKVRKIERVKTWERDKGEQTRRKGGCKAEEEEGGGYCEGDERERERER